MTPSTSPDMNLYDLYTDALEKVAKNVPTSPDKWARAKAQARAKFDVYPSAYANGWAAKKYKAMGGGWKKEAEFSKEAELDKEAYLQAIIPAAKSLFTAGRAFLATKKAKAVAKAANTASNVAGAASAAKSVVAPKPAARSTTAPKPTPVPAPPSTV